VENFSRWKGESQIAAYMRVCGIMELEVVKFNTACRHENECVYWNWLCWFGRQDLLWMYELLRMAIAVAAS